VTASLTGYFRRTLRYCWKHGLIGWFAAKPKMALKGSRKRRNFNPIWLDVVLPVLNGLLKRLLPKTPIVIFTTFTDPHIKAAALAVGVQAVVDKSEGATLIGNIQQLFAAELPPPGAA
jgi:hypothetical protein